MAKSFNPRSMPIPSLEFISEWTKNMGVDFLDKELKEKLKHVFMEYCE